MDHYSQLEWETSDVLTRDVVIIIKARDGASWMKGHEAGMSRAAVAAAAVAVAAASPAAAAHACLSRCCQSRRTPRRCSMRFEDGRRYLVINVLCQYSAERVINNGYE